jgi:TolA-binding protein
MKRFDSFFLALVAIGAVGCLQTRSDVKTGEQRQVLQQQVGTLQKTNADIWNRISELEEQLRFMNGRVEVLEGRLASASNESDQLRRQSVELTQGQNQKFALYQEALEKMEQNISALQAELTHLRNQPATPSKKENEKEALKADPFGLAESHFSKREFKAAIVEYQRYVEKNPKGKKVASATYKIGVSFQELGMKGEAKAFYDDVIANHPRTDEAKKAKIRLQKMK